MNENEKSSSKWQFFTIDVNNNTVAVIMCEQSYFVLFAYNPLLTENLGNEL